LLGLFAVVLGARKEKVSGEKRMEKKEEKE
jgi:hypothetical protein